MRRGNMMDLPKSTYQSWKPAFTGEYNESEMEAPIDRAEPGSIMLDIGCERHRPLSDLRARNVERNYRSTGARGRRPNDVSVSYVYP